MSVRSTQPAPARHPVGIEKSDRSASAAAKVEIGSVSPDTVPNFQVRRPDTLLFATLEGLQKQSGVSTWLLRRLMLKELADNALDAADAAGQYGQVEIKRLDRNQYSIADQGGGIHGTPEDLAKLFALDRPMVSGKFWRLPERGALGNGLRIIVGTIAATGGTLEISTHGQRVLLHPRRAGHTQIMEVGESSRLVGTEIIVTFGHELPGDPDDLSWAEAAIKLARVAGPPYGRRASSHWFDVDHLAETLSIIEPPETTVRQFLERLDGCTGATAGRIAAAFGKGCICRDLTEAEASQLLTAAQEAAREIKPLALGPVGISGFDPSEFDGYARRTGSFSHGSHTPKANIPFIVEAWAYVTDRKGHEVEIAVMANRTPIVDDVTGQRSYKGDVIELSGAGLWDDEVDVKKGDCSIVVHVTSPLIPILSIGKRPNLSVFQPEISEAIRLAFNQSRHLLPPDPAQPKPPPEPAAEKAEPKAPVIFIPQGPLGQRIEGDVKASGMSIDDLTVLSVGLDPYRFDNAAGHRNGAWFAEQVAGFVKDGADVHLRGLFYRIVAVGNVLRPDNGQVFINTETDWRWLKEDASKAARWLRYVPFDRIRDERNEPPVLYGTGGRRVASDRQPSFSVYPGGMDIEVPDLDTMLPILLWNGVVSSSQPFRIAFIGEKSSLGDVLRPIAEEAGAELLLSSGDCSETHIAEMAARAAADGRPFVVLYFCDFDPGGYNMPTGVARKFQAHRDLHFPQLEVQVHHVALTVDQVRQFNLPSTPLKEKERRAAAWRTKWGHDQTEIDALAALRPDLLEQIAREALRPFYDPTLAARIVEADRLPSTVRDWFEALPEYTDATAAITEQHAPLAMAADALNHARERQIDTLRIAVDMASDAPKLAVRNVEPIITAKAPEPIFTTSDNFIDASRKLVARKRLTDVG